MMRVGLYSQAAAGWQIDGHWSLQAFGRCDWNESINSGFNGDLDGWSAGPAAGHRF